MYGRLGVKSDQNLIDAFEHFVLEDCEDIKMSRMLKATLSRCTQYTNTQYFFFSIYMCTGQGWRSGESTRLPPMWPGFKSRRRRHMWVEFVVGSLPCSKRFFFRVLRFSPLLKNQQFQILIRSGTHGHV